MSPTGQVLRVADLVARYTEYLRGDQRDPNPVGDIGHLDEVRRRLDDLVPIAEAKGPRRQILAAFALEAAAAGLAHDLPAVERLLEWACELVRHDPIAVPPNPFDHLWQLASIAVLEGALDPDGLDAHLNHVAIQFPAESRVILGRAIAIEQRSGPAQALSGQPGQTTTGLVALPNGPAQMAAIRARRAEEALARFRAALSDDRVADPFDRAEASLRAGHLQLDLRHGADALPAFAEVERLTQDPVLVYLARLFRGQALEEIQKPDEARTAYLSALQTGARVHSATMALAALDFGTGRRQDADQLIDALLRNDPRNDPWWSYRTGDYRLWDDRIVAVRSLLREMLK